MERKVRDSCGKSASRTPQVRRRRGGSPTARGKRVPGVEIQRLKIVLTLKRLNKVFFCFKK
ncbi:hypothetical protein ACQKM1_00770 [Peribacillus frigoritolerans]|uniref:hypothetical protein n=1 Tax=Peribacillus frigoritolerans TaxID=450367 RepID=UPI003D0158E3